MARVKMESVAALQRKPGAGQGVQKSSLINPDWTRSREPDLEMSKEANKTKGCYWEKMQNGGQRPRQRGRTWTSKSMVREGQGRLPKAKETGRLAAELTMIKGQRYLSTKEAACSG